MRYNFKCNCGESQTIECKIGEISSKKVICPNCGKEMKRVWSNSFIIPEHMKTENTSQMSYLNNIMKKRPSGKRKILY